MQTSKKHPLTYRVWAPPSCFFHLLVLLLLGAQGLRVLRRVRWHSLRLSSCLFLRVGSFLGHAHFAGLGYAANAIIASAPSFHLACSAMTQSMWSRRDMALVSGFGGRGSTPSCPGHARSASLMGKTSGQSWQQLSERARSWPPSGWTGAAALAGLSCPTTHVGLCSRNQPHGFAAPAQKSGPLLLGHGQNVALEVGGFSFHSCR